MHRDEKALFQRNLAKNVDDQRRGIDRRREMGKVHETSSAFLSIAR